MLSLLALNTQATIQYTDLQPDSSFAVSGSGSMNLDVDGDSNSDFTFVYSGMGASMYAIGISTSFGEIVVDNKASMPNTSYASALFAGTEINSGSKWANYQNSIRTGDQSKDKFMGNGERFIGFRFEDGNDYYYGWMLVEHTGSNNFMIKSYAIEDSPNTPIIIGDNGSQVLSLSAQQPASVKIYPTLTDQELNVESGNGVSKVEIYNLAGGLMLTKESTSFSRSFRIDLSGFAAGVYIVSVKTGSGARTSRKFVKQ